METGLLNNKVFVVMGGTSGMGLSASRAITAAGAKVVAVGNDAASDAAARESLGDIAVVLLGDATLAGVSEKAIEQAMHSFGRFDGLYHVAGGSGRRMGDGPLHEMSEEGWDYTLRLNLKSMFLSNRAAVRELLREKEEGKRPRKQGGVILNMGSVLAWSPSPQYFSTFAYSAAKSAVVGMTQSAAAYYATENIRFNVIAPGLVNTPMARRAMGDEAIVSYVKSKQLLDGGRVGQADDLDAAVVYLLSDGAKFVTGQVLAVDGGWSVTEGEVGG